MTEKSHLAGCWLLDDVVEESLSIDFHRFSRSVDLVGVFTE